jgi:hypothetical protein
MVFSATLRHYGAFHGGHCHILHATFGGSWNDKDARQS